MLRNYLVVAWRNLRRHRLYSLLNILGLALGMACCLLVFLFVWNEWSYDAFHQKADRTFLVYDEDPRGWLGANPHVHPQMHQILKQEHAGVASTVQIVVWRFNRDEARMNGRVVDDPVIFADPEILQVFTFPLSKGDRGAVLSSPNAVVLTERTARKYWGEEEALGKTLSVRLKGKDFAFTVTGIAQDVPSNTTLEFDLLLPMAALQALSGFMPPTGALLYVQLELGVAAQDLEDQFPALLKKRFGQEEEFPKLRLQPLPALHFGRPIFNIRRGYPAYARILSAIALLVLLISCANFINLAIGRAATRVREIGVRKVAGARFWQLMRQFWGEALLMSLIALVTGFALAELFLPTFNALVQRRLAFDVAALPLPLAALGLSPATGVLAGTYPALVLSRFQPVAILKDTLRLGGKSWFSRGSLMLQFASSTALVIAVLVMGRQMDFMKQKHLGFNGEQVIALAGLPITSGEANGVIERYQNLLVPYQDRVLCTAAAAQVLGLVYGPPYGRLWHDQIIDVQEFRVDHDFVKTLELRLVTGRDFDPALAAGATEAVLINQSMARSLGWDDPVGQYLPGFRGADRQVIGVVEDFHYSSVRNRIEPVVLSLGRLPSRQMADQYPYLLLRLSPKGISGTMQLLRDTWKQVMPDREFCYTFVDDIFDGLYREEERWQRIIFSTSAVAVVIAGLGLFGLASLAATRRTKEVGIRKVLGASVPSLVLLLSKEFTYLVLAANLIAWPVAYDLMSPWLVCFAYRIELGPGVFVLGGLLALGIAWLTVSWQAIRAALANPVEALRYE
jgi:putative ABC transport system permease protein